MTGSKKNARLRSKTPDEAMSLSEENQKLRKELKEQPK